ncbi:MAG: VanZ family protein [Candidatus Bipolaricaulia bacterium]
MASTLAHGRSPRQGHGVPTDPRYSPPRTHAERPFPICLPSPGLGLGRTDSQTGAYPSLAAGASGVCDLIVSKLGGVDEFVVLTSLMRRAPRAHELASWRVLIWGARLALGFAASDEFRQSFILVCKG